MKSIETTGKVSKQGRLIVQIPPDIKPGAHRIVIVIEEETFTRGEKAPFEFPVDHYGSWPAGLSLKREDIYSEDGR